MYAVVMGCSGFIGKNLTRRLLKSGYDVIGVYNNVVPSHLENECSSNTLSLCHTDNLKQELCLHNYPSAIFFDLAWSGTSGSSRSDLDLQLINIKSCVNNVKLCSEFGMKYVGSGTIMEKESIKSSFNDESHPNLSSYYSHMKYLAHALSKSLANECGVHYSWARITNSFGPGENSNRLICTTLKKILSNEVPVFSSCSQLYDFIYIDDLINALLLIGEKGKNNADYVIGSGKPRPLKEYMQSINKLFMPQTSFVYGSNPDVSKYLDAEEYDISKLTNDTGFYPNYSFEEGIKKTFQSYII